jgi:hypothetical protein
MGRIANDPSNVGRVIDYVAAAPWPPSGVARMRLATMRAADALAKG